ncbi:MAG: type II 3-dehydroquinate dehydratase [Lewinellaceae bacterium]|nr:type II 3-dehydroquinate dehydratase [Saprospiraceae bacterium]MCB9313700.1 type II 3-dehydroquinate dehydratase [Lewinellaceae bacterium]HRW75576.1 type II 3-dehydroquinate dehydratase [Saprospiraceae bacterium]
MRLLVLNGPNLNLVGQREPDVYGHESLADAERQVAERYPDHELVWRQSNHEGQLIDWLHAAGEEGFTGVIINPGGLTHTSVALADAIRSIDQPVIEVHISNIHARETFRQVSLSGAACRGIISGLGLSGYALAVQAFLEADRP